MCNLIWRISQETPHVQESQLEYVGMYADYCYLLVDMFVLFLYLHSHRHSRRQLTGLNFFELDFFIDLAAFSY